MSVERLTETVARCAAAGGVEIALADSIGVAVPTDVIRVRIGRGSSRAGDAAAPRVTSTTPATPAWPTWPPRSESGVHVVDSRLAASAAVPSLRTPRATSPPRTVYMLDRMGYDTGVSLEALIASVPWVEDLLEHPTPGLLARAGPFPPRRLNLCLGNWPQTGVRGLDSGIGFKRTRKMSVSLVSTPSLMAPPVEPLAQTPPSEATARP